MVAMPMLENSECHTKEQEKKAVIPVVREWCKIESRLLLFRDPGNWLALARPGVDLHRPGWRHAKWYLATHLSRGALATLKHEIHSRVD